MKRSRYSDSQIISILKQAEAGTPATELCREHGMSDATFYKWRSKFGGMDVSMMARMMEIDEENRLYALCGMVIYDLQNIGIPKIDT
jgi:putative transposase